MKDNIKLNKLKDQVRLRLGTAEAKIAIKTAIVAFLGWTIGSWFSHVMDRPNNLVSGLWCTLTAMIVLQAHLGGTYKAAWIRFSGVVIGSILGALCTIILGANPLSLAASIFFTVLFCFLLNIKDSIRISCISVTVVMVLWGLSPAINPWTFAFFRAIDSLLGIVIAVVVAHILWPKQAVDKLTLNMSQILCYIRRLFNIAVQIEPRTQNTEAEIVQSKHEVDALLQEDVLILEETKIELWSDTERLDQYIFLHERLQHMRRVVMSLNKVYGNMQKIIDQELSGHLNHLTAIIDQSLHELSQSFLNHRPVGILDELSVANQQFNQALIRFRETRSTRNLELPEVEAFYAFFYNLNVLIKTIFKIAETLDSI